MSIRPQLTKIDVPATSFPRFWPTISDSGVDDHHLSIPNPNETTIYSPPQSPDNPEPLPSTSYPRHGISIDSSDLTWEINYPTGRSRLHGSVNAVWVPVLDEARLKMESLEIVIISVDSTGTVNGAGKHGLPEAALRILEVNYA